MTALATVYASLPTSLNDEQSLQYLAYVAGKLLDGEDASSATWSDAVAAGYDRLKGAVCIQMVARSMAIAVAQNRGTVAPNNAVAGRFVGQRYLQMSSDNSAIVTEWVFFGTPNQEPAETTGWVTYL